MRRQLLFGACAVALLATSTQAALVHRYSFESDASDSVGSADGVIMGNTASFSGGELILDNPDGVGSAAFNDGAVPDTGAFVDFPNHLFSQAAAADQYGAVTVELWVTMDVNRDWSALFSAGSSSALEGNSAGGNDHFPYVQIIPRTGDGGAGNDLRVTTNGVAGPEGFVDEPGDGADLTSGVQEHIVAVFNQSGGLPGTITVFRNGVQYGDVAMIAANLDLAAMATAFPVTTAGDVNVWLGRSQWPDALVDASIAEMRIYSHALTINDAIQNGNFGPNSLVPEPATCVLAALGIAVIAWRRRA
ncbi:MAG: hypothetical protein CMJ58_27070 [Planctomycetaceae bacterium]|nr:hypothetical protein [Planctomycetaceae bacterium]